MTKATPTGVWFLVHHAHQIITIASFNHYWHCTCAVMQSAASSLTKQTCIKTMLLISLTLLDPTFKVLLIDLKIISTLVSLINKCHLKVINYFVDIK